jgi:hypothetical protein
LSSRGKKIYLHGFDGQDFRVKHNKLNIGTWHSSKGTENKYVVVLGLSEESDTNPAYVALTRSFYHLIIIQDENNPNQALLRYLKHANQQDIQTCYKTQRLVHNPPEPQESYQFNLNNMSVYSLDSLRPKGTGRWIREFQQIEHLVYNEKCEEDEMDIVSVGPNSFEDTSEVYVFACCMAIEYEKTGKVRFLDDIKIPVRLSKEQQNEAIMNGHNSRFISPTIPLHCLLAQDMANIIELYGEDKDITPLQWCKLGALVRCWNEYHHTMRQLQPFNWFDEFKFKEGCRVLREALPDTPIEFDVRVRKTIEDFDRIMLHARVHAKSQTSAYFVVWSSEVTHSHKLSASIRACLCDKNSVCVIINIRDGNIQRLTLSNADIVLNKLLSF